MIAFYNVLVPKSLEQENLAEEIVAAVEDVLERFNESE
jgi:hypothetical protein